MKISWKLLSVLKQERGAATIVEYTLILPLVMAVVVLLIYTGFIQHQRAVLESATVRGAIVASKWQTDPHYRDLTTRDASHDLNEIESVLINESTYTEHRNEPYRYLFDSAQNAFNHSDIPEAETYIRQLIEYNQIFLRNSPEVDVHGEGTIFHSIVATTKQDYAIPIVLPGLQLPPLVTLTSESTVYVNQPSEFIRNADLVIELIQPGIDYLKDKLSSLIGKIKTFDKSSQS